MNAANIALLNLILILKLWPKSRRSIDPVFFNILLENSLPNSGHKPTTVPPWTQDYLLNSRSHENDQYSREPVPRQ